MHSQCLTTYATIVWINDLPSWLLGSRLSDHPQIVGDDTPADPAFHALGTMIPTPVQFMASLQSTDAALDARAPIAATPEPPLVFIRYALGRFCARLGQHDLLDPVRPRIPLVRGGVDPAISGEQSGRVVEHAPMMVQTRWQLYVLGPIAVQHRVPADNATLDLIQPEDTAELSGMAGLAFADNGRVGFEQTYQFFRRRHGFPLEHQPG